MFLGSNKEKGDRQQEMLEFKLIFWLCFDEREDAEFINDLCVCFAIPISFVFRNN